MLCVRDEGEGLVRLLVRSSVPVDEGSGDGQVDLNYGDLKVLIQDMLQ